MNVYNPTVTDPIKIAANTSQEVLTYGNGNLYPQQVKNLITASKTACKAVLVMADNIECDGFVNPEFGAKTNENGRTMNDVLRAVASDLAHFNGAYLIVQYNALGLPVNLYNVPFEDVRIHLNDDYKNNTKITKYRVFNNWNRDAYISTNVNDKAIDYPVFNPANVRAEIEAAGDISNYNGQILAIKSSVYDAYPLSPFHAVREEMFTEQANAKMVMRILSKGFHSNFLIEHGTFTTDEERAAFRNAFDMMRGYENTGNGMLYENNDMQIRGIFIHQLGTPLNADDYKAYQEPLKKDICMAANNLPIALIDMSAITFTNTSGATIKEIRLMYRESLNTYRNMISRAMASVFGGIDNDYLINDKLNVTEDATYNGSTDGGNGAIE